MAKAPSHSTVSSHPVLLKTVVLEGKRIVSGVSHKYHLQFRKYFLVITTAQVNNAMSDSPLDQLLPRSSGIKEAEFRLVKPIKDNVWLAERTHDNEPFIARRLDEFDEGYSQKDQYKAEINGMYDLLQQHQMMNCIAHILNHENVISIAGHINMKPLGGNLEHRYNAWLVWDYCDAGTLETALTDKRLLAAWQRTPQKLLPESLCWHVLISMLRALAWLHDGKRVGTEDGRVLSEVDKDWMPILHGCITPKNIHFQHPRGREVFGLCKLANFGTAFVSGKPHINGEVDTGPNPTSYGKEFDKGGVVASLRNSIVGSRDEIRHALEEDAHLTPVRTFAFAQKPRNGQLIWVPQKNKPYTVHTELWNLGMVIFRMMTNVEPPSPDGCETCHYACTHLQACSQEFPGCRVQAAQSNGCSCKMGGCAHILSAMEKGICPHPRVSDKCKHRCERSPLWYMDMLWKRAYSQDLISAVSLLLQLATGSEEMLPVLATSEILEKVQDLYACWKFETTEGKEHVDVDDDLEMRVAGHR